MKIERRIASAATLEGFAKRHNLTMLVVERERPLVPGMNFYAQFKNVTVKNGWLAVDAYGDGITETAAIEDYAHEISGRTIFVNGREIEVPLLWIAK